MELNKLAIGALIAGGLTAAGGGAYLAVRHNAADTAAAPDAIEAQAGKAVALAASGGPGEAVTSSEGIIDEAAVVEPGPAPAPPVPAPAPVPVATSPRRARTQTATADPAPRREPREPAVPAVADSLPPQPTPPVEVPTSVPSSDPSAWETRAPVEPVRPERPPDPPEPALVELIVPADSVLGLQIDRTLSSESARVEDRVEARVTRDIRVGDRVAIPAGAVVQGSVTDVDPGGKVREVARLAVRFHTVVLDDGTRLAIATEAVIREGQPPGARSAAKIGGAAVGGAILGAILGGGRGAAIGGAVGAAGGTAATMAGGRSPAVLSSGTTVSVRIQEPVTVTVDEP